MSKSEIPINEILAGVEFYPGFDSAQLRPNEGWEYLEIPDAAAEEGALRLIGFGSPRARTGGFDLNQTVNSIVRLEDLHESARSIDLQGKGVGARMYNTPAASTGLTDAPARQGVYIFDIDPEAIDDRRTTEGGKLLRIARHGSRIIRAATGELDEVVDAIHAQSGDKEAVLHAQPPRAAWRQTIQRHAASPDQVPAEFMIIRSPDIALRRIGEYTIGAP
jgi:hypothetical protein